jgi:hypothetical protein
LPPAAGDSFEVSTGAVAMPPAVRRRGAGLSGPWGGFRDGEIGEDSVGGVVGRTRKSRGRLSWVRHGAYGV